MCIRDRWTFCLPLFGSIIFQQLYNLADSFVAGKFIGEDALAAVGNGYEITLIFIAFAFGCNIGSSVVISRLFGAKQYDDLKTAVHTTFISCGVLCLLLMTVGILFTDSMLRLINTPESVMADSALYLDIYIWGLPFVFFYNVSTGIFSALGDSKTPFIFLAASSLANIGADILSVTALGMGVDGVAWATFICQGISCILAVVFVLKRLKTIPAGGKARMFSAKLLGQIARIAVPSILQQSFISVGNIAIQGVVNTFDTGVMAGYSAAVKLNNLVTTSFTTLGNGISNYTAQNIGAKKHERVRSGFFAGIKLVWALCVPMFVLYFFFGRELTYVFLNTPTDAAFGTSILFLRVVSPFYFVIALKLVADGILRGAGRMARFMIATFTDLAIRVILAYVFAGLFGSDGIWFAWPAGWVIATVMSVIFCFGDRTLKMRKKKPVSEKA